MQKISFNDGWLYGDEEKSVTLPHDAMIHTPRNPQSAGGRANGFFDGGVYVYTKSFFAPAEWRNKHTELQFEGVYRNSSVYLNGQYIGGAKYGYIPFFVTLDTHIRIGEENELRVVADNSAAPNTRWYSGGGIYRPVWLWIGEKEHIKPEGLRVTTLCLSPTRIRVETGSHDECDIEIYDGERCVSAGKGSCIELDIPDAKLWSAETPNLYRCKASLGGDVAESTFGIRQITWDNRGLYINGKRTLLKGGCIHHDNGILGAASYDESEWRRVKMLKESGFNAIRSAHNPCARATLEACDALGMYVLDELWDMWYFPCNKNDYALNWEQYHEYDIAAMTARDYNHPSVIMYSIGNEVTEPAFPRGVETTGELVKAVKCCDGTRPVTMGLNLILTLLAKLGNSEKAHEKEKQAVGGEKSVKAEETKTTSSEKRRKETGINSTVFNMMSSYAGKGMNKKTKMRMVDKINSPALDLLDIAGYNYATGRYLPDKKLHPNRLIFGSETYPQDIVTSWKLIENNDHVIGDFIWTAWDYIGEAGIGAWAYTPDGATFNKPYPWLLGDTGAIDIIGTPNAELALVQSAWHCLDKPYIGVMPVKYNFSPAKGVWRGTNAFNSWAWRGCDGNRAVVEIYAEGDSCILFVNGKPIGKRKLRNCKATFKTKYEAGTVSVQVFDKQGTLMGENSITSSQGELSIGLEPENACVQSGEIAYVNVTIKGENGVVECNADEKLFAEVENGELLAFGSAQPRTMERYDDGAFTTYYGRALAVVRATATGTLKLKVKGMSLAEKFCDITVNEGAR